MAKSNKTDKPEDAATKDAAPAKDIVDAEIVEETPVEPQVDTSLDEDKESAAEPNEPAIDDVPNEEGSQPEQAETVPEPQKDAPKSGFLPLVLGGVLAAGVGFGAASYLGSQGILFGDNSSEAVADLTRQLGDQGDLIHLLQSNQDKIAETANAAREGVAGAAQASARVAALSERVEDLGTKLVALEGRMIETEKRPMTQGVSSSAIEAYEREVEQLRQLVSEQLAEAEDLKDTSTRSAQQMLAQAALTRVIVALESGAAYRGALTELAGATGMAIPDALSAHANTGVPTIMNLGEAFPAYARAALADARKLEKGANGSSFTHFLKTQLGARSTEPKDGDDADAILSRTEAALREGRLQDALTELKALPPSSQALLADWRALAETRLAAAQALEDLAQNLNSN